MKKPKVAVCLPLRRRNNDVEQYWTWNVPVRLDVAIQNAYDLPARKAEFLAEAFDHASELAYRRGDYFGQDSIEPILNIVLDSIVFESRSKADFLCGKGEYSYDSWRHQADRRDALCDLAQHAIRYARGEDLVVDKAA